jgi:cytochrome P450
MGGIDVEPNLTLGERPSISDLEWVTDYADAQAVLRSADFASSLSNNRNASITRGTLLSLSGAEHMARRRAEMTMFARDRQQEYEFGIVRPVIGEIVEQSLAGSAGSWAEVDLLRLSRQALVRVSARTVGLDNVIDESSTDRLLHISHRIGEGVAVDWTNRPVEEVLDEAFAAREEFITNFFEPARQNRLERLRNGEDVAGDVLGLLLSDSQYSEDYELLVRECLFFLGASANTTTHLMPHLFLEIARWFDSNPDKLDLAMSPSFLQRAASEGLRLHPLVPALSRVALEDVTLPSGRIMAKGTYFGVDINAINRDAAVFGEDAEEFNPFREPAGRAHLYGSAFGQGPHVCPGRVVAVGAANGAVQSVDASSGVVTRMLLEFFAYDMAVDPDKQPTARSDTATGRYASFGVLCRRRANGAVPVITADLKRG